MFNQENDIVSMTDRSTELYRKFRNAFWKKSKYFLNTYK